MTRLHELTARLIDGTLTAAEGQEFDALVASDPAAVQEHLALLELEAALRGLRIGLDLTGPTLEKVCQAQAARTTAVVMAEITTLAPPAWAPRRVTARPRRRVLFAAGAMLAVAAALVIGIWLGQSPRHGPIPAPDLSPVAGPAFARLTSVSGSVEVVMPGGETVAPEVGHPLTPGEILRTLGDDSHAELELPDRTRFEIEPGTVVRMAPAETGDSSAGRLFLATGQMTTTVAERPDDRPLVVGTPAAKVFARRGRFVVSTAGPASARVEPQDGTVQVVRTGAPVPITVLAGRAAIIRPESTRVDLELGVKVTTTPRRSLAAPGPRGVFPGIRDVAFAPDGREVWVVAGKHLVRWTLDGGTADVLLFDRKGPEATSVVTAAKLAPDRTALVVFRGDKVDALILRNLPAATHRTLVRTRTSDSRLVAIGPGADWVATVPPRPNHRRVSVWDGTTGTERFAPLHFGEGVNGLTASPDGRYLAVGLSEPGARGTHNKVVLFDPASGKRLFALPTQKRGVTALEFSPDGRFLAAGFHGQVQVWDVRARELVRTITGFERVPGCLAFTPDGRQLAAGTQDGRVWVWNVQSGRSVQVVEAGGRGVRAIAFSPDGRSLVTATNNAPVKIWDLAPEQPADVEPDA